MADELSLPRLKRDRDNISSSTVTKTNLQRKRVRDTPPPDSSDPPIFSSDDDPSIEKYTQKRRKQRFRGPWFDQQLASDSAFEEEPLDHVAPTRNKRTFSKKVDSGVFMGSDDTDIEDFVMVQRKAAWPARNVPVPLALRSSDTPDIHAQRRILRYLEDEQEYIDLSLMGLYHLENSTIRPLQNFIKTKLFAANPENAQNYANFDFEPSLKIILSRNDLEKLPAELFNLKRLTYLSLRDNKLQEIPSSISKLKILEDLNISSNKLGYLPYEIIDLLVGEGKLYDFQLHPNPFYRPMARPKNNENGPLQIETELRRTSRDQVPPPATRSNNSRTSVPGNPNTPEHIFDQWDEGTLPSPPRPLHGEKCSLSYQFRTEIRFFDFYGKLAQGPMFPSDPEWKDSGSHVELPVARIDDIPKPPAVQSRVQSLVEKALQACSRSPDFLRLESHPESYLSIVPPQFPPIFRRAKNVNYSGPTLCTICKCSFIIPRTEWIEWWEIEKVSKRERLEAMAAEAADSVVNERDAIEKLVPLIRRGCSWLCVPSPLSVRFPEPSPDENESDRKKMRMDTDI